MRYRSRFQLWFLIAGVLIAAGCSTPEEGADNQSASTATPIPTAPAVARPTYVVQRGDVQEILEFSGRWQPRDQAALAFEIQGSIRQVTVQRGDTVKTGDLLADYQITDLENQLADAQIQLDTAIANLNSGVDGSVTTVTDAEIALANARLSLESTKAGSPWTSTESARLGVESAQQAVQNAQRAYDDAVSHPEQGAAQTDSAYQALQSAQNQLASAQVSYSSAAQSYNTYQYQIAQAENAVIKAELDLENARNGGANPDGQAAVESAQLNLEQIQASIARSSLYSPIDGVVLEVSIKPGDSADAFETVIVVGLPEPQEAIASLAFADTQRLSIGLIGICQLANHPETAVQCIVRQVPLSSRDADQNTHIAASLDNIATGQLVDIQMPLQVSEGVLWLPPSAIRTFQNRTFVVLETPDGPRSVDVELGLQTDDRVEIISGVNEGDVVQGP